MLRCTEDEIAKHDTSHASRPGLCARGSVVNATTTDINLIRQHGIVLRRQVAILSLQGKINPRVGGLSQTGVDLTVGGAEGQVLLLLQVAPPSRPRTVNNLNDNHCVVYVDHNPQISFVQTVQSSEICQTSRNVSDVVSPAHFFYNWAVTKERLKS